MTENKPFDFTRDLDLGVIGYSGLKQTGGVISEEWHSKLRGQYGPKVYREMSDGSSAIGAIQFVIESLVRGVEWRAEPADDTEEAKLQAAFVEECIEDMSQTWEDFISEVLSFLAYGWSYFEIVYKVRRGLDAEDSTLRSQYDDGKIGWRKFALRAQDSLDRWEFDPADNGLVGMHQVDYTTGRTAFIPIEKSLLFRTRTAKDNPEGRSIFRNAVNDYFYLKRISEIEAIGIERDMTGLVTMEVPIALLHPSASGSDLALRGSLEKMLGELKRDERDFALIPTELNPDGSPTGYKLKLLSTGGSRQIDTNAVKTYYRTSIFQSVIAQFLQLGVTGVGSFALASTATNLFAVALGTFIDTICSTFNRFAVSRLMSLNGVPPELWPYLVHGDLESQPLDEIGRYITALATAGQLPEDEALQNKLLEIAKLPIPDSESKPEYKEPEEAKKKRKRHEHTNKRRIAAPLRQLGLPGSEK